MQLSKDEQWLLNEKYDGSTENKAALRADLSRLALGEPVAYVIGWQPFLGLRIYLDSHPLIPRPETEWWTEQLIDAARKRSGDGVAGETSRTFAKDADKFAVLDLCAGSGAIGCSILQQVPKAHVSFGELMPEHEQTILKNIRENRLDEKRAVVRIGDLFAPFAGEKFDVIAANPPYIPEGRELDRSVAQHEPREALRAGNDGLELIKKIAKQALAHMNSGGELWLECDSEHASEAEKLVAAHATRAELRTDLYGRPRLVVGYY